MRALPSARAGVAVTDATTSRSTADNSRIGRSIQESRRRCQARVGGPPAHQHPDQTAEPLRGHGQVEVTAKVELPPAPRPGTVPGAVRIDSPELPPAQPRGAPITFDFEGRTLRAFEGEPVAVALHAAGIKVLGRSSKYHRPRGLFCLEGHCASCYLRIDGRPNRRACMTPVRAGLRCERQNAFPTADVDLLRAADWLFPEGMDHHTLMTQTRVGNLLFLKLVRQMGGSGMLPDGEATWPSPDLADDGDSDGDGAVEGDRLEVDLCVVGGGPAGLAAARACRRGGAAARGSPCSTSRPRPGVRCWRRRAAARAAPRWPLPHAALARASKQTPPRSPSSPRTTAACWRWSHRAGC